MSENKKTAVTPSNTATTNSGTKPSADHKSGMPGDRKNEIKEAPDAAKTTAHAGAVNTVTEDAK